MALLLDLMTAVFLLLGSLIGLTGGIGVHRLPDFFTRLHACGLTDSACTFLVLTGLMLQSGWSLVSLKLIFILIFLLVTSPTASHALAKTALGCGEQPLSQRGTED